MIDGIFRTSVGWLTMLLVVCFLLGLGCGAAETPPPPPYITYTFDEHTQKLISVLANESQVNPYKEFERHFSGLYVPESLLLLEPFVLSFSTKSIIPTVLLLEAHWVERYGRAGWLYKLERSQVKFPKDALAPKVAEPFSISLAGSTEPKEKELMGVPTSIRGNVLFFRKDLLERYHFQPPRNWEELKAICQKILPQERHLKYGLILHPNPIIADFFPILWGFGGHIMDDSHFVLARPENQAAFLAALKEIQGMQGTILPAAKDMHQFEPDGALVESFSKGEVLFMINWNIHLKDLSDLLSQEKGKASGGITSISQVGIEPIPSKAGHPRRYTNLDSHGWAVNSFAADAWNGLQVMEGVNGFLQLVVNERFQLLAAETWWEVPSLRGALEKLKKPEVLQVYNEVFAAADVEIRVRPHSRLVNNVLEKHLEEALQGQHTPEVTLERVLQELK